MVRRFLRANLSARLHCYIQQRLKGWVYVKYGDPPVMRMRNALVIALHRDMYELVRRSDVHEATDYRGWTLPKERDVQPKVCLLPHEKEKFLDDLIAEIEALDTPRTIQVRPSA